MTLVEIFLPVRSSAGQSAADEAFGDLRRLLTDRFGGLTAFTRSPAQGVWIDPSKRVVHDDIVVVEVITDYIDRTWWSALRKRLEQRLHQTSILIRASEIETL